MGPRVVVYGAGRIGKAVARAVAAAGWSVVLAGRDPDRVRSAAMRLDLPFATATVTAPRELDALCGDALAVVNAAGPLSATVAPLLDAAVRTGTHYLDVANEPRALAAAFDRHRIAADRGVCVVVGLGPGVAVSEAAAADALSRIPQARQLEVLFAPGVSGVPTPGVARTALATLTHGPHTVTDGRFVRHRPGWGIRAGCVADGRGASLVPVFTGDVVALARSQRVSTITVYTPLRVSPASARLAVPVAALLLGSSWGRWATAECLAMRRRRPGSRAARPSVITARATGRHGEMTATTITTTATPEIVTDLVIRSLRLLDAGQMAPGAWTPCQAIGPATLLDLVRAHAQVDRVSAAGSVD